MGNPNFGKDQPAHYCGKRGRSGPVEGNTNALQNGSRVSRFKLGKLTGRLKPVYDQATSYCRKLTKAVVLKRGVASQDDLSERDRRIINTAASAEMHAGMLRWCLRHKLDTMDARAIETNSQKQYQARLDRNALEKELGIDIDIEHTDNPWGAVDASPVPDNGSDLQDK